MTESNSTRGVLSLVFGILGITGGCPCLGSILAIVCGWGDSSGVGRAGVILGWVGLAMMLVTVLFTGLALFVMLLAANF